MNLLKELEGNGWKIQTAVQTTFPFDPDFYSRYVAPRLARRNCTTPLVLVDGGKYEAHISDEWASAPIGSAYLAEPVNSPGVFHPKVNLYASDQSVYYTVTSANLTLAEYCDTVQIGQSGGLQESWLDDDERDLGDIPVVAREIRDYFSALAETPWITGAEAQNYIDETTERLDWLDNIEDTSRSTYLVTNLDGSIIDQVTSQIGSVETAQMSAPFWGSPEMMEKLSSRINSESIEFIIEDKNTDLEIDHLQSVLNCDYNLRKLTHDAARWVHAKVLVLNGSWGSACLFGSPNMTGAALLADASNGNTEAGLLRIEEEPEYFDMIDSPDEGTGSVLTGEAFRFSVSDPVEGDAIIRRENDYEGWKKNRPSLELRLLDARLSAADEDGESTLHLSLEGATGTTELMVTTADGTAQKRVQDEIEDEPANLTLDITEDERDTWSSASLQVEAVSDGVTSNIRRVTLETQEYFTQSRQMKETDGRAGSDELINAVLFDGEVTAANVLHEVYSMLDDQGASQASADQSDDNDASDTGSDSENWDERRIRTVASATSQKVSTAELVTEILEFHLQKARSVLETENPGTEDLAPFVEHGDAFWELIELCLLSDHVGVISNDDVIGSCQEVLSTFRTDNVLTDLRRSLNSTTKRIEGDQLSSEGENWEDNDIWVDIYRVFFIHPAFTIEIGRWRQDFPLNPVWLFEEVYEAISDLDSKASRHLLEPETSLVEANKIYDSLKTQLSSYEDDFPVFKTDALAVATFTIMFHKGEDYILKMEQTPDLSEKQKSAIAEWTKRGRELLPEYEMNSLHLLLATPGLSGIKQAFQTLESR